MYQCLKILKYILKEGNTICRVKYKKRICFEEAFGNCSSSKIYALVNRKTASAAEVFASAVQTNGGKVVGEKTFGKGLVQRIVPFFDIDGSGIKFTVAEIETATGEKIDKIGISPDVYWNDIDNMNDAEVIERVRLLIEDEIF